MKHSAIVLFGLMLAVNMGAQAPSPEVLLKAAMQKEQVDGDLPGAMAQYKAIVEQFPKDPAAPKALLQMAGIYERQENFVAVRATYQRIVGEYANSGDPASTAAQRLGQVTDTRLKKTELEVTGRAEGMLGGGRVSPDGRWVSFADQFRKELGGTGNLAVWGVQSGSTVVVNRFSNRTPWEEGSAWGSVWSPDGSQLAYAWQPTRSIRGELRIVTRSDGRHRTLVPNDGVRSIEPMAWSADGRQLLVSRWVGAGEGTVATAELVLMPVGDGPERVLRTFRGALPGGGVFSPDGRHVAFDFQPQQTSPARDIAVFDLETGREVVVSDDRVGHDRLLAWLREGYLLFTSDRDGTDDAWLLHMENGKAAGSPQVVTRDVGQLTSQGVTRDGRVFVWKEATYQEVLVAELDPTTGKAAGPPTPMPSVPPGIRRGEPAWSPDGARIAYVQAAPGVAMSIVVRTWATGQSQVYPVPVRNIDWPLWDRDGKGFIFDGTGDDNVQRTFRLDLTSGRVDTVTDRVVFGISRDGQWRYQQRLEPRGLAKAHVSDGHIEPVWAGIAQGTTLSPDGGSFAFFARVEGKPGAVVHILPVGGGTARALTEGIRPGYPRLAWSGDSRHVIFNMNPGGLHRVSIEGGAPEPLGIGDASLGVITEKSVSADGRRIAFGVRRTRTELWVWGCASRGSLCLLTTRLRLPTLDLPFDKRALVRASGVLDSLDVFLLPEKAR